MGIKISELPQASQLTENDVLPIVQSGDTKKISVGNVISNSHNSSTAGTYSSNYINDNFNKLIPKAIYNTSTNETYSCSYVNGAIPEMFNSYSTSIGDAYSCNYINSLHTYSTDEQRIGTWIDGKPLYRTTIKKTTGFATGETVFSHGIANISEFVSIQGILHRRSGDWEPIPAVPPSNSLAQWEISVYDFDATRYRMFMGSSYTGANVPDKMYLTLEYTKTTD